MVLVLGQEGVARKVTGHLQFLRDPSVAPHGLEAFHHNNQMLDFRDYTRLREHTFMDVFSHLGDVLMAPRRRRDCRGFPNNELLPLLPHMDEVFRRVDAALREAGIDHCACRDDWITCEQDIVRIRKSRWFLRWVDSISPNKPAYFDEPDWPPLHSHSRFGPPLVSPGGNSSSRGPISTA
jgi:hypothetical protein